MLDSIPIFSIGQYFPYSWVILLFQNIGLQPQVFGRLVTENARNQIRLGLIFGIFKFCDSGKWNDLRLANALPKIWRLWIAAISPFCKYAPKNGRLSEQIYNKFILILKV